MTFQEYVEDKIGFVLFSISFIFIFGILLFLLNFSLEGIIFIESFLFVFIFCYFVIDFHYLKKRYLEIIQIVDSLKEKYLISEVLPRPRKLKDKAYFYALKQACKAMNDEISRMELSIKDHQEYMESFVHEIKTPISSLLLYCENNESKLVQQEVAKIDNYVEQMLFFSRSEITEKDYFVKKIKLEDLLHPILLNYRVYFKQLGISLSVENLNVDVYTDEKWLTFILSQILQNAIKYSNKKDKKIEIFSKQNEHNIFLVIKDYGVGIREDDLSRVFEKGFTGSDRNKQHSTGIGLYLCKKLCDRLDLEILIDSKVLEYTEVTIIFPIGKVHDLS